IDAVFFLMLVSSLVPILGFLNCFLSRYKLQVWKIFPDFGKSVFKGVVQSLVSVNGFFPIRIWMILRASDTFFEQFFIKDMLRLKGVRPDSGVKQKAVYIKNR